MPIFTNNFKSYHFGIETRQTLLRTFQVLSLNRTILELKQYKKLARVFWLCFKSYHFGIETVQSGDNDPRTGNFKSYHFGIEEFFDLRRGGWLEKQKVP